MDRRPDGTAPEPPRPDARPSSRTPAHGIRAADPPLAVAFDGRALISPAGGVRRYLAELVRALRRDAPHVELVAVGGPPEVAAGLGVRAAPGAGSGPTNLGWAALGLPRAARRVRFDVFHAPAYTAPLWGVRPLVLTLHDVAYARRPEWYPYRRDPLRRAFYRASARRADWILTDSRFSQAEIVTAYGVDPDRITVVPLGVAAPFGTARPAAREPFVLHVGDLHARRNLDLLLDVVLDLRADPRLARLTLVLAGADRGALDGLRARAAAASGPPALDYRGAPDDAALAALYGRAGVFAYPSRYEGFGLPVLEAMACGAPIVATSAGAVPEVTGDAAILVAPDDARGWRDALRAVLTDPARAADLSARGAARAARFTWSRTAAATLAVYRVAARTRRP